MTPEQITFTLGAVAGVVIGITIARLRHAYWCEYICRPRRYRTIL